MPGWRWVIAGGFLSLWVLGVHAQEPAKQNFDLPADLAVTTFKLFSRQSGRGLIADADLVRGIRTNAVRGDFTPRDAIDRMLVKTGLASTEDPKNGAFVVHRENPGPNGQRAARPTTRARPEKPSQPFSNQQPLIKS